MTMPPPEPLCEYCSRIPLNELAHDVPVDSYRWTLAPGERIKRSNCPFCRVVASAFQTLWQTEVVQGWRTGWALSKKSEVKLRWIPADGPGGRGAFTIDSDPSIFQIWICTAATVSNKAYLKPTIEAEFDVDRLSAWISTCTWAHSEQCSVESSDFERSFPGLDVVRFIDVEQAAIVELHTVPRYVALSYVWGEVASVRLTTGNRPSLLLPGGIRKAWHSIPQTIRDAIELVRRLGARYLWVDAFCLIQNDPRDVACGVNVMDEIYERSWLTIIAAYGHNANAGLPGIQEGSRFVSTATRITHDISVGLHVPLDRLLKCSVYASRAWTFQEQLLARRAIYFVEKQVFFRCREDMYAEQLVDQRPRRQAFDSSGDYWSSMLPSVAELKDPLSDFEIMLMYYTPRALTNPSDILRAMAGVVRRLSERAKCRFFEGLPNAAFGAFVVFRGKDWALRRREGFPSYSWTGWEGGIIVGEEDDHNAFDNLNKWLDEDTWIIWYKRSPSGVLNLVWDPSANELFPLNDPTYHGYRRRHPFQAPAQLHISSIRTYPTADLPFGLPTTAYHLLQFWTLSVYFKLQIRDIFAGTASILTAQGIPVGTIYLDGIEERTFFDSQDPLEFILLSGAWTGKAGGPVECSKYFIMLLEWNGPIAERRGLGLIDKSAIIHSSPPGPQWKKIILG
ncbi:heterokaryon incompatibility protein-domain-containing protein [Diplogelasinospora grovesii]|uniref:Heterokaryon incompatibility protein-domain-containing protein n=1 Tax=Diplogelasinospora grovesii TaxID=303347 RepID=A0AAN6N2B2_9PEZI|nr:heterokaryon incompatibility protein-domain-containing protein [Diplogelasinospora grovesii]